MDQSKAVIFEQQDQLCSDRAGAKLVVGPCALPGVMQVIVPTQSIHLPADSLPTLLHAMLHSTGTDPQPLFAALTKLMADPATPQERLAQHDASA